MEIPDCNPRSSWISGWLFGQLLFNSFDLDQQFDFVWDTKVDAPVHAPLAAHDGGFKVTAAHFTLEHGMVIAIEIGGFQHHGPSFAQHGQLAGHF